MQDTLDPKITYTLDNGVATVTICNPDKHNAVSPTMWDTIAHYFTQASWDPQVRAVIFTGQGKAFCSGSDLGKIEMSNDVSSGLARLRRGSRMVLSIHKCDKPVIAAVPGAAAGVGLGLALGADFIIASETAKFGGGFLRVGLVPDGGTLFYLVRNLGESKARAIAYTAQLLTAAEAHELGLVLEVVPCEMLMERAREFALQLANGPTGAIGLTKRLFRSAFGTSLEDYLEAEEVAQVLTKTTDDFQEGVSAFLERRPAAFTGK
jgi:2-(1,2-epoxy-1,2-dihydrophenyl)acetyl-CoA isomerase